MVRKIVKQGIFWFSNVQIRYFKDLCEPCLSAPELGEGEKSGKNMSRLLDVFPKTFLNRLSILWGSPAFSFKS